MPYSTSWLVENRVVLIALTGTVNVDDIISYSASLRDEFLESGKAPVHLVFDLNHMAGFPTQVIAIKRSSESYMNHPSLGWAIFVGINNPLLSFVANTVSQILKIKSQQAKSVDEALTGLKRVDTTLDSPGNVGS